MGLDPIVEEVRKYRQQYAEKFNFDLHAICVDLRQRQKNSRREVIHLPPKRASNVSDSAARPFA